MCGIENWSELSLAGWRAWLEAFEACSASLSEAASSTCGSGSAKYSCPLTGLVWDPGIACQAYAAWFALAGSGARSLRHLMETQSATFSPQWWLQAPNAGQPNTLSDPRRMLLDMFTMMMRRQAGSSSHDSRSFLAQWARLEEQVFKTSALDAGDYRRFWKCKP